MSRQPSKNIMSTLIVKVITVVLKFSSLNTAKLIEAVNSVLLKMTSNSNFPTPDPPLATITTQVTVLEKAAANAKNGTKAAKAQVPVERRALMLMMKTLKAYVETIANGDAVTAEQVALTSGMSVKKVTAPPKRKFSVKNLAISGMVKLTCPRNKGDKMFDYCYTITPDDLTSYINIGPLTKVTRTVDGLGVGKKYYFRYRYFTKEGASDWSDAINIIIT